MHEVNGGSVEQVSVYNPDRFNPYAREVAGVLVKGGFRVVLYSTLSSEICSTTFEVRKILADSFESCDSRARAFVSRVVQPARIAWLTPRKNVVIAAWLRDPWDVFCFWIRAVFAGRMLVVYHNPRQVRPRGALMQRLELILLRKSQAVVLSEYLVQFAEQDLRTVSVAIHPPFTETTASLSQAKAVRADHSCLVFLGKLRPDKGGTALVELAKLVSAEWSIRFVGTGVVPEAVRLALEAEGVRVMNDPLDFHPSDKRTIRALQSSGGLLAPYSSVTTSSSMHFARTLSLPIFGLRSPATASHDDQRGLAETVESLALILESYFARPWAAVAVDVDEWEIESIRMWKRAVDAS